MWGKRERAVTKAEAALQKAESENEDTALEAERVAICRPKKASMGVAEEELRRCAQQGAPVTMSRDAAGPRGSYGHACYRNHCSHKRSKGRNMRASGKLKGKRRRGRQLGAAMHVAELLERKRTLLDDRQEASPDRLIALDHEIEEIDGYLTRVEWAEAPPTAPH